MSRVSLEAGTRLGQLEVVSLLGEGGMGQVYRARDPKLGREVAVKVLPEELAADPARVARFRREAQLLASLSHPHVAAIHGFDDDGERHFLVMELVDGQPLDARLRQGPLPLDEAIEVARQVAEGLEAAHASGIVHRDLKPANVMVRADGQVKLLDFGLAKALVDEPEAAGGLSQSPTLLTAETQHGVLLGTAAYMSPEQARGKKVDARTDVWAFGCLLHEMLTGKRAFPGETVSDTLASILKDGVDEGALPPETPGRIRRLLRRCLQRDPRNRLQSIGDARVVLQEVIAEPDHIAGEGGVETPSALERALPWLAALALLAVGFVIGKGLAGRDDAPPASEPGAVAARLQPTGLRPMTGFPGLEWDATWSPDERLVAYARCENGPQDIFVMDVADPAQPALPLVRSASDDGTPRWSPDGRWIAFTSNRGDKISVYLVPPEGGEPRRLADTGWPPLDLDSFDGVLGEQPWSPDGGRLVFSRKRQDGSGELVQLDLATESETVLTQPPAGAQDCDGAWSWDGRRLAWSRHLPGSRTELWVRDLESGEDRLLVTEPVRAWSPAWSPDGLLLLYGASEGLLPGLRAIPVSGGEPSPVTIGPGFAREANLSRTGRIMTSTFSHVTDLYLQPLDGGAARRLTAHALDNFCAQVSPDGRTVAYMSSRTGDYEIWALDLATREERRLTSDPANDSWPAWSPDGGRVAFVSDRGGRSAVWVVDSAGLRTRRLSPEDGGQPFFRGQLRWSPDGELVGFLSGSGGSLALHVIDLDGEERGPVIEDVQGFGWYRDSQRVIYTTGGAGDGRPAEMRARHLGTGEEVVLLQRPHVELEVALDGSAVSYCRSTSHFDMNLELLRLLEPEEPGGLPWTTGEPVAITHGNGEWHVHNGGFSPDGRSVVYTRDTDSADLYELEGVFPTPR